MTVLNTYEWGAGEAEPLICLHGVTGHGARFAQLAARLDRRVIGVDLLGHGHSSSEPPWDLEANLDALVDTAAELGIERAIWAGHSFGGRLVAELVARNPEVVSAAILFDPALFIDPATVRPRAEGLCLETSFGSPDEAIAARLGDGSVFTTPRTILEDEMANHLVRGDDERWRFRFSGPAAIGAWSIMSRRGAGVPTRVPTLVVFGERSWIAAVPTPRIATIHIVNVPGGHSVLWDDFDQTANAVAAFLELL